MFRRILIANRGEIALRVQRTAKEMGIEVVAVFSEADRNSLHVRFADRAYLLGPPPPAESYLRGERILEIAQICEVDAIHPGFGFLSENAGFAQAVREAGLVFVGPPPEAISRMGDKISSRRVALEAGVPVIPGADADLEPRTLLAKAREIGFPVLLKAAAGGGGKGIKLVREEGEFEEAFRFAAAEAEGAFGDGRVYLEKFLDKPRHVEIQVMADRHGGCVTYGERECSVQRRHQKLVEESPSPAVDPALRARMEEAAKRLTLAVGYEGAGTIEFMVSQGEFYFLEMNTRLQVEHAITEERFGVDLVAEQLRIAAGETVREPWEPRGHSIEVRINAEDPVTFFPSLGTIERLSSPGGRGVRFDSAIFRGLEVSPYYDSMLAKLIVWAEDRERAIQRMLRALAELRIAGVQTSVPAAVHVLHSEEFRSGDYDTSILEGLERPQEVQVLEVAGLAAAYAKYRGALIEDKQETVATGGTGLSPWVLRGRMEGRG
ncbi:MAG TPA: acetyl-CoA carboxylase biotin carboxylase subunit [Planctomycetes bacterium]|nr:acetyl-CoA carboxylase biotin carboxylase subunit [Planctomycetota bacterium]